MASARTRICSFELDARGFVVSRLEQGAEMQVDDAHDAVRVAFELMGHKPAPVLVDLRGIRYQSRQARDYLSSAEIASRCLRVALLVASPVSQVIGSFFMRLRQQPVPTRLFDDEQEAVSWLLEGGR